MTDHIERFTRDGVRCVSGQEIPADIVVTATGLELQFCGGMTLSVDGEVVEPGGRLTYKGVMLEDVPNLAVAIGYTNASWTLKCELACELVCRVLAHMRETGRRVCRPQHTDDAVAPEPLLGLTSGYVQRGAHLFPKQGAQPPWRVHQSFLADLRELRRARLDDGVLVFSDPVPDLAGLRP